MFWIHLAFALVVAAFLSLLFVAVLGWRRPGRDTGALLTFFLIVFLVTWAGGVWMTPFGPTMFGAPWLVFVAVGVAAAIVLAAVVPPPRRRGARAATGPEDDRRVDEVPLVNWFFWLLVLLTALAVLVAYV